MAIVTTKSTVVGNRDSSPRVINDGRLSRSNLKSDYGSVAVGAADSATSFYPLVSVRSSAMVRRILADCPAGMTTLAGNIGVWKNTVDSGGVALGTEANTSSGSLFASAQSFASVLNGSDVTNESTTYTSALKEMPLWQAIGLTSDPNTTFDIGVKVTTANTGAAGRIGLEVQYVDNSN